MSLAPHSFERITYAEAVDTYGSDKPDLRIAETIRDLTENLDLCREVPFLERPANDSTPIRGLRIAAEANPTRGYLDKLTKETAKRDGIAASWFMVEQDGVRGPIKMDPELATRVVGALGLVVGDAYVVAFGKRTSVSSFLGRVRIETAPESVLNDGTLRFTWIVDFPMFEEDEHNPGQLAFAHNPFSMPRGEIEALNEEDPLKIVAQQYDLVCNGIELSSGAVRNHQQDTLLRSFEIAGYSRERVEHDFPAMLKATGLGMPPHAGIAPGVERTLMATQGMSNIRDFIAFPLTQSGADALMGAPADLSPKVLAELGLAVLPKKADA
jgi:aspartyl-tRNA synthetase